MPVSEPLKPCPFCGGDSGGAEPKPKRGVEEILEELVEDFGGSIPLRAGDALRLYREERGKTLAERFVLADRIRNMAEGCGETPRPQMERLLHELADELERGE